VCLKWQIFSKPVIRDESKYNYWKADYAKVRELASINWQEELEGKSVNDMWVKFVVTINACVNSYVPLYKRAAGSIKSPWISKETKKLLKKCDRAWLAYKRNKCRVVCCLQKSKE